MGLSETQNSSAQESLDLSSLHALMKRLIFCPGQTHWSMLGVSEPFLGPNENPIELSETQNTSVRESLDLRTLRALTKRIIFAPGRHTGVSSGSQNLFRAARRAPWGGRRHKT